MKRKGYVLVTGTSKGIGAATARHLADLGYTVFGTIRREEDNVLLREQGGGRVRPVILDITKPESIQATRAEIAGMVGDAGLAALVNNAGVIQGAPAEFQDLEVVRRVFETNFLGHMAMIQAFLPLVRRGRGRIINLGSGIRFGPTPFVAAYAASKAALAAFTDVLRMELRPWRIPVIMVDPGATNTPIWQYSLPETEASFRNLPPSAQAFYEKRFYQTGKFYETLRTKGSTPEQVARVVGRAVTSPIPRNTYLVGRDAILAYLSDTFTPRRLYHRILERLAGAA